MKSSRAARARCTRKQSGGDHSRGGALGLGGTLVYRIRYAKALVHHAAGTRKNLEWQRKLRRERESPGCEGQRP